MAIFHFKLKTVHRLKIQYEDQAKNRLGYATSVLNAAVAGLDAIYAAVSAALDGFRGVSGGRFSAGDVRSYNCYIAAMKEKAKIQKTAVREAEEAVDEARLALARAARQREMYDKLREKAYAAYVAEERRLERLNADGLISYRGSAPGGAI